MFTEKAPWLANISAVCAGSLLSPAEVEAAFHSIGSRWNAAAANWDVAGLAALYVDEAVLFGGRPGHSVGKNAIRDYFFSYNQILASVRIELFEQHVFQVGADALLAQGHGNFHFVRVGGKASQAVLRTTWAIARRGTDWLIFQHHFSASPESPPIPQ